MATRKQGKLPGITKESIKELDAAAEAYVEVRDERMALTKKEVEAKATLTELMQKHKLTLYKDDSAEPPLVVELTESDVKVKVRREQPEAEEDGE